ncbi:MAG: GIY-YIG nuclease family protein [Hyphomicrobiales bacterium]|nr:GIY-YIG nuclease family protein [Hyphomicrobiales bacterium]
MQYIEQIEIWLYRQFHGIENWLLALSAVSVVTIVLAIIALVMVSRLGRVQRSFTMFEAKTNAEIVSIREEHNKELSRIQDHHTSVVSDLEKEHTKRLEERGVQHKSETDEMSKKHRNEIDEMHKKHKSETDEMHKKIDSIHEARKTAEAKARELRAGWVYVASNIGSFGHDVYKIGMTKRDDPDMRIAELSDASVPFPFELHARVQSEDAYSLETELHRYFADRSFNMANSRRKFFKVPFSQIKNKLLELAPDAEIVREEPEAPEYKMSQSLMREKQQT